MQKLFALFEAVTARAMLAVAGIAHMDLVELAHHTVAVEPAIGHAAGDSAVDRMFHIPLLCLQYVRFFGNYIDKRTFAVYNKEKEFSL